MPFQRRSQRVEPVRGAEIVFQIVVREHILDAKLDDVQMCVSSELDFSQDLLGSVCMRRENQHHYFAALDRPRDLAGKGAPRLDIAWGDPTADGCAFNRSAHSISYRFILRRI